MLNPAPSKVTTFGIAAAHLPATYRQMAAVVHLDPITRLSFLIEPISLLNLKIILIGKRDVIHLIYVKLVEIGFKFIKRKTDPRGGLFHPRRRCPFSRVVR